MVEAPRPVALLYVGDDPSVATGLADADGGFSVECVPDADAALERLAAGGIDCVLADSDASGDSGVDVLDSVRSTHPDLPCLFLIDDPNERAAEALEAGATDVAPRAGPARDRLLANRIEAAVDGDRAGDSRPPFDGDVGRLPVGVYRSALAPDGDIVGANPAFASILGADSVDDVLGTDATELYRDPADRAELRRRLDSEGVVRDLEVPAETLAGDSMWLSITAVRTDGDGRAYADGVVRDIAPRKRRETELSMFRRAVEASGHSVYFTDRGGTIEYVNEAFEETTGYAAAEAIGQTPRILKSGAHDRSFYEALWETILSGDVWRDEIVNRTKSGERYVADQTIAPVEGPDGDIERFVAVNVDITDRKEREQTLEQFRSAVEHAGHAVLITDADGTIEYVNDAFEGMSGYSAAEAIGRTPSILKSGAHDDAFYRRLWGTILSGDVWRGEVTNERKDGERYVVDQTIAPITDGDETTGFVAINHDVTDLKAYERQLEEQNERLKQYGHSVAHDLRNPLTLLRGELDDLEAAAEAGEADPETVVRRCRDVEAVVDRMELLIEDLLTMAEQGQRVLEFERVDLEAVAEAAWEQVPAPDADLRVEATTVEADPDRLRELLSNLFRNAIEHGGPDVTVRAGPLDFVPGFFVADDGPGIPPEERERVLDRGFTTHEGGTGFGLAIVEQIADAHGWSVAVTEGAEGGARFEFRAGGN